MGLLRTVLRPFLVLVLLALLGGGGIVAVTDPASAEGFAVINGGGSTWSQVAIDQWAADVRRRSGLVVNYEGSGSTRGRLDFGINAQLDFGVSEIPYQAVPEGPGTFAEVPRRAFQYMPIVAGGTSFMYNLKLGNAQIRDLRLSSDTIAKIFTGVITRWDDPQIAREYGKPLPGTRITPVVRSDGSGTTAQFTAYLAARSSAVWDAFCRRAGRATPCGLTSFFPTPSGFNVKASNGSNGVSSYVASGFGNGTITYVEYAYAKQKDFPVVKVLNAAGYYVGPTAANVAVALTAATQRPDRTQVLTGVYANQDRRAYPLSSYSYMLVPTAVEATLTLDKGRSLSTFANYFLCEGQKQADILGYSPLPKNLVTAGFDVVKLIPGAVDADVDLGKCGNPTFSGATGANVLLDTAPFPPECDRATSAPCGTAVAGPAGGPAPAAASGAPGRGAAGATGSRAGAAGGTAAAARGAGSAAGTVGSTTGTAAGPTGAVGTAGAAGTTGAAQVDPETGQVLGAAGAAAVGQDGQEVTARPVAVGSVREQGGLDTVLYLLVGLELLLVVLLPPVVARARRSRPT